MEQEQQSNNADSPDSSTQTRWQTNNGSVASKYISPTTDQRVLQSSLNGNTPGLSKVFSSISSTLSKAMQGDDVRAKKLEITNMKMVSTLTDISSLMNKTSTGIMLVNSTMNSALSQQTRTNLLLDKIIQKLDKQNNNTNSNNFPDLSGPKSKSSFFDKAKKALPSLGTLGKVAGIGGVVADVGFSGFNFGSDLGGTYKSLTDDAETKRKNEAETKRVIEETRKLGASKDHSFWGEIFGKSKESNTTAKLDSPAIEKLKDDKPVPAAKDTISYEANTIIFNAKELKINGIELASVLSKSAGGNNSAQNQNGQSGSGQTSPNQASQVDSNGQPVISNQGPQNSPAGEQSGSPQQIPGSSKEGPQSFSFGSKGGSVPSGMQVLSRQGKGKADKGDDVKLSGSSEDRTATLLRKSEGFQPTAKWDVNHYRLGYGSDTITNPDGSVREVKPGDSVSREDAERDLKRRIPKFQKGLASQVGVDAWNKLNPSTQAALTSVGYNYGSFKKLPSLVAAIQSGDKEKIAGEVENLQGHNGGINRKRRLEEAKFIKESKDNEDEESKSGKEDKGQIKSLKSLYGESNASDDKSKDILKTIHPDLQRVLLEAQKSSGMKVFMNEGDGLRTKEQAEENFRKGTGIVNSYHRSGHAADQHILDENGKEIKDGTDPRYAEFNKHVQDAAKKLGVPVKWGGSFKKPDWDHWELPKDYGDPKYNEEALQKNEEAAKKAIVSKDKEVETKPAAIDKPEITTPPNDPTPVDDTSDKVTDEVKKKAIEEKASDTKPVSSDVTINNTNNSSNDSKKAEEPKPSPAAPSRESLREHFEDWT